MTAFITGVWMRLKRCDGWFVAANFAILLCLAGYYKGMLDERATWHQKQKLQHVQIELLKQIAATETTDVQTVYVDRIRTLQAEATTIIKKVPHYVTKYHDTACPIPPDFVRLWNAINSGETDRLPAPADRTDAGTEKPQ